MPDPAASPAPRQIAKDLAAYAAQLERQAAMVAVGGDGLCVRVADPAYLIELLSDAAMHVAGWGRASPAPSDDGLVSHDGCFVRHKPSCASPASDKNEAERERAILTAACKPWGYGVGDPPPYGSPLANVFDAGVTYAIELLAEQVDVKGYQVCDGAEVYRDDIAGTLHNVLDAAGLVNEETGKSAGAERDEARAEVERLRAVIERERSLVASGVAATRATMAGRAWLRDSRGPYAYDDERYQTEFGDALSEIEAAMEPLARIAGDWSDCPTKPEDIAAARIDWRVRAEAAERDLKEARAAAERVCAEIDRVERAAEARVKALEEALRGCAPDIPELLHPLTWLRIMIEICRARGPGDDDPIDYWEMVRVVDGFHTRARAALKGDGE